MADFKTIETQEEFDRAIQKRLEQKDREAQERYKGYLSPDDVNKLKAGYEEQLKKANSDLETLTGKVQAHDKEVQELTQRAVKAESAMRKGRIATEYGIPLELSDRLIGENEEDLKKDAETFASFMGGTKTAPPLFTHEPAGKADPTTSALVSVLSQLNDQFK